MLMLKKLNKMAEFTQGIKFWKKIILLRYFYVIVYNYSLKLWMTGSLNSELLKTLNGQISRTLKDQVWMK
jgi:hypothetical protein